jgi:glutaminase
MDKKISISQIKEVVQQAYEQVKGNTGGKNADYIPYLANIDKNLFGISVCLLNGQTITVGDFGYRFGIESVSKVHTAILILRQYGAQKVLEMIGADATGLPFNSIIAIQRRSKGRYTEYTRQYSHHTTTYTGLGRNT